MDPALAIDPRALPEPLPRASLARPAEEVARDLLGARLVRRGPAGWLAARIVETEAYVGAHDRACHASRGRTARTETMFGPPGRAYVYFVYGMWHMLNVVTGDEGEPQAVLIRAAEPLGGPLDPPRGPASLSGPGRLARALALTLADDGRDLAAGAPAAPGEERPALYLAAGAPPRAVAVSARIGVESAGDWAAAPLRFFDPDSPSVSGPRRPRRGTWTGAATRTR